MLFIYPAIFHKENDAYWVEFPDLQGCQTYGDNITEAMSEAQDALYGYLITLLEENKNINPPSELTSIQYDEDSFVTFVTCNINQYKDTKAVKKTLTIPAWLNERAVIMGINFSQVLQDALMSKIQSK